MFKTFGIFRVFQSQIEHILTDSQNADCDIYVKWLYFDKMTYLRSYGYNSLQKSLFSFPSLCISQYSYNLFLPKLYIICFLHFPFMLLIAKIIWWFAITWLAYVIVLIINILIVRRCIVLGMYLVI